MTRGEAIALLQRIDRILADQYTRETRDDARYALMDARMILAGRDAQIRLDAGNQRGCYARAIDAK